MFFRDLLYNTWNCSMLCGSLDGRGSGGKWIHVCEWLSPFAVPRCLTITTLLNGSACVCCHFSCVRLCVTPWTVARQVPLFMGFPRQEYWSGLPCPPPGDLPNQRIEPASVLSPALVGRFFTTSASWEAQPAIP